MTQITLIALISQMSADSLRFRHHRLKSCVNLRNQRNLRLKWQRVLAINARQTVND